MVDYSIQLQYSPPPSTIPEFFQSGFFFNNPEHLEHQRSESFYVLSALNHRTGLADARCAFFLDTNRAISPAAAPFGSIEFTETLPGSVLDTFLYALTSASQSISGLNTLQLTNYPACYAPEQTARLIAMLPKHGFRISRTDYTFYLPISRTNTLSQIMASAERRRLRKGREAGFQCQHWIEPNVTDVVNFIRQTRQQQGYRLTICPDELVHLLEKFPERFPVFTVNDGTRLAALAVAVRVRDDILYTFLPASNPDYQTFSPMVMLMDELYTYCQCHPVQLLDLGMSLDGNNLPKASLANFKRKLGALESPKLVFEKSL